MVFTAGNKQYADSIIDLIDPEKKWIDYRVYRNKCIRQERKYVKDLRIFKNRDLKNMIMIDNSIISFANHLNNGIHISNYFGSSSDSELQSLLPILIALASVDDVQE